MLRKSDIERIESTLEEMFPEAFCELIHQNPFELVVAVALSAQATDVLVNKVTPGLFAAYPTPDQLAAAPVEEIEEKIKRLGLYRNKAKNIKALAEQLLVLHGGEVPTDRAGLEALPGVGRKTANVVLSVAFDVPALQSIHMSNGSRSVLGFAAGKTTLRKLNRP